jgi:hypothetical protein
MAARIGRTSRFSALIFTERSLMQTLRSLGRLWLVSVVCVSLAGALKGESDQVVVFGAGNTVAWGTELAIANTGSAETAVVIRNAPDERLCPPLSHCENRAVLPPGGTAVLGVPEIGVGISYVSTEALALPTVTARALRADGTSFVDLPVFRLTTLLSLAEGDRLVFAGARKSDSSYSNLELANMVAAGQSQAGDVQLVIQVRGETGDVLGEMEVDLAGGQQIFLTDVCGQLGVASLSAGSVAVTRIGGSGRFWGILLNSREGGGFSVSLGLMP